ncbi:hypothetical protein CHLNCDRAFT_55034 [Chlorella variabilis]|uniref:Sec-independent translocase n=1 Tax=Chlorella variabilis TaxID=554065 RepID=E1ZRJ1_CHLVA|nr:hypothetical protein CHLNCDRAFT_55034 [Chlorella variabilis]EFN51635.1 hypothetical protein CHLNCDRAFT_55034 [Chlorella variabilis]|eukprot:XP_005843737.1 hypothetical protein CHLNCDRAFT_55034 [Chlorella variabilis]
MFSLGEMVVLAVAAAWVFGPNELPRMARAAGRLTGQATGFLYRTRARFFQFAEETEMTKLHQEVQATMHQLHAIRSELQGGINIFSPGPLAQRVMSIRPVPGQGEVDPFQQAQQQQFQTPQQQQQAPAWAAPVPSGQQQQPQHQQRRLQPAMGSWAASALPAAVAQAAGQRSQPPPQQQQQPRVDEGAGEQQAHPLTVPVSAVAAGLAPDRSGTAPTGSEILLDALAEELLAAQVLRLQQQQMAAAAAAAQRQQQAATAQQQQQQETSEQQEAGRDGAGDKREQ